MPLVLLHSNLTQRMGGKEVDWDDSSDCSIGTTNAACVIDVPINILILAVVSLSLVPLIIVLTVVIHKPSFIIKMHVIE